MNVKKLIMMATAGLLLTGCSDGNDETAADGRIPLVLTATVDKGEGATRATADGTWTLNALVAVKTSDGVKQYKVNNASTGELLPNNAAGSNANTHYWHSTGESKAVSAWYYGDGSYGATFKAITVPATQDQNTVQNYDLLYAKKNISYTDRADNTKNCLTFYHQMTKITVNMRRINDAASYNVKSVALGNSAFCRTGTFNEPSSGNYGTWSLGTSNKSAVTAYHQTTPATGYDYTFTALVVPQSISGGELSIVVGFEGIHDLSGSVALDNGKLEPGCHYTFNLTVDKQQLTVNSANIQAWSAQAAVSKDARSFSLNYARVIIPNVDRPFTGSPYQPTPDVIASDGTLLSPLRDYTVSYANNVNPGTATLTVTGSGQYSGTNSVRFKISKAGYMSTDYRIGYVFYSDGTYSATKDASKTAIGIIAYINDGSAIGNALTEKASGYGHGLVMSLNDSMDGAFDTSSASVFKSYVTSSPLFTSNGEYVTEAARVDAQGLAKTAYLDGKGCRGPGSVYYSSNATGCSYWFIPSAGQMIAALESLAGKSFINNCEDLYTDTEEQEELSLKVNSYLTNAGGSFNTYGKQYWTSSFCDINQTYPTLLTFWIAPGIEWGFQCTDRSYDEGATTNGDSYRFRAFCAF